MRLVNDRKNERKDERKGVSPDVASVDPFDFAVAGEDGILRLPPSAWADEDRASRYRDRDVRRDSFSADVDDIQRRIRDVLAEVPACDDFMDLPLPGQEVVRDDVDELDGWGSVVRRTII